MSPRLRLSLRALRVSRAIHTTPSAFASDPDLPPARKTAEDLGFTGNKGRLRDLSKLSIPTSGRSHIASLGKPTRKLTDPSRPVTENRPSRPRKQQASTQESQTPESSTSPKLESETASAEFFQDSDSPEAVGVTSARQKKNQLDQVNLDLDADFSSPASSGAGGQARSPDPASQVSRRDTQSGPSRPPRRNLPPLPRLGGPRRDFPVRDSAGGSPRPARYAPAPRPATGSRPASGARPRSARPPRSTSAREDRPMVRRQARPPPPPAKIDQSWDAVFGRSSVVMPVPRNGGDAGLGVWAKGLEQADARRQATLSLAGDYSHILPKTPLPSDPSVSSKPVERAKSTVAWTLAMNQSCTMGSAKLGEDLVARFMR